MPTRCEFHLQRAAIAVHTGHLLQQEEGENPCCRSSFLDMHGDKVSPRGAGTRHEVPSIQWRVGNATASLVSTAYSLALLALSVMAGSAARVKASGQY